jgi:hypothetical protein
LLLTFFIPLLRFSKFIESPPDVRIGSKADLEAVSKGVEWLVST